MLSHVFLCVLPAFFVSSGIITVVFGRGLCVPVTTNTFVYSQIGLSSYSSVHLFFIPLFGPSLRCNHHSLAPWSFRTMLPRVICVCSLLSIGVCI